MLAGVLTIVMTLSLWIISKAEANDVRIVDDVLVEVNVKAVDDVLC